MGPGGCGLSRSHETASCPPLPGCLFISEVLPRPEEPEREKNLPNVRSPPSTLVLAQEYQQWAGEGAGSSRPPEKRGRQVEVWTGTGAPSADLYRGWEVRGVPAPLPAPVCPQRRPQVDTAAFAVCPASSAFHYRNQHLDFPPGKVPASLSASETPPHAPKAGLWLGPGT